MKTTPRSFEEILAFLMGDEEDDEVVEDDLGEGVRLPHKNCGNVAIWQTRASYDSLFLLA